MGKTFLKAFYDDDEGIHVRFRDGDYSLDDQDKQALNDWLNSLVTRIKKNNCISKDDVQDLVFVIETLNKSDQYSASHILSQIYYEFDRI